MGSEAEVVRDPNVPTASEASEIALKFINHFFNKPGRAKPRASIPADPLRDDDLRLMAFIRSRIPSESPATKRGEEVPSPPPDKPEAKCDGSGILIDWDKPMGQRGSSCTGCPACKPKPDDAEEVARKIVYDWKQTDHNAYSEGLLTDNELAALEARIIAAIRADRQNRGPMRVTIRTPTPEEQRAALEAAVGGKIEMLPGYNNISPDLAGKVRELCKYLTSPPSQRMKIDTISERMAREVLAMMEER